MPTKQVTYNPYNEPNSSKILSNMDGGLMKKAVVRRTIDYHTTLISYLETSSYYPTFRNFFKIYPTTNSIRLMNAIPFSTSNISHGYCTKYVSTSINKNKCSVNCLIWSPDGRRLITGNYQGQFTLWNGLKFNFDTILPAHKYPIKRIIWKYDSEILISCDRGGIIKYWTSNLKNLISLKCHDESINDICISPTYCKFASASSDSYIKIYDFTSFKIENNMKEHGWDVTCIDWHPFKSLIISGSKDNLIKLWDPKTGHCIKSLYGAKNTVSCLKINKINGNWLISGSKDQLIKMWDLRMLKKEVAGLNIQSEMDKFNPNISELSCLSWHPFYESLFVCGGKSGNIKYYKIGNSSIECEAEINKAHEQIIWDFAWHPLGHILASSSNDQTTKFWTRNRPGDTMNDQYNINQLSGDNHDVVVVDDNNNNGNDDDDNNINVEDNINENYLNNNNNNSVHPERMRQMHNNVNNNRQLPGIPYMQPQTTRQQQPPPQYYHNQHIPPQQHPYPIHPPPPPYPHHPPPPPHPYPHHQPQPQQHLHPYNNNNNNNNNDYRTKDRHNNNNHRRNRNRNRNRRSRSRSRDRSNRKTKQKSSKSTVPGLNFGR